MTRSRPGHKLKCVLGAMLLCMGNTQVAAQAGNAPEAIEDVLDAYHQAAAVGDWDTYFDLMSENSVFLGTDVGERWTREEFRAYAGNRSGWIYRTVDRHIDFTPDGDTAWFDEVLDSASYGTARGSGVVINTGAGWKISQYHLTFPIPNELVGEIIQQIKAFEAETDDQQPR